MHCIVWQRRQRAGTSFVGTAAAATAQTARTDIHERDRVRGETTSAARCQRPSQAGPTARRHGSFR